MKGVLGFTSCMPSSALKPLASVASNACAASNPNWRERTALLQHLMFTVLPACTQTLPVKLRVTRCSTLHKLLHWLRTSAPQAAPAPQAVGHCAVLAGSVAGSAPQAAGHDVLVGTVAVSFARASELTANALDLTITESTPKLSHASYNWCILYMCDAMFM